MGGFKLRPVDLADGLGEAGRPLGIDRFIARRILDALGDPPLALVLWNGEEIARRPERPLRRVRVHDRLALLALVVDPELRFGDLYRDRRVTIDGDLVATLVEVFRAMEGARPPGFLARVLSRLRQVQRANDLAAASQNVHHHYDIGNAFYELWLDDHMQYTCAYYPRPGLSLGEAQEAKMHHVCRKLRLSAGETVVEAGCGWGGLARFMASRYGVRVRAYNLSREQVAWARDRATREGLTGRVEFVLDDYRNITGHYDAFVSVGMLEHVGPRNYAELGDVIDRSLAPHGRGLIHSIGRNRPGPLNAWIERRIFPGGHPPTLGEMAPLFEPHAFSVLDVENLRLHYARTLGQWLERFDSHAGRVAEMFDEAFVRTWRLYLASSLAAFVTGSMQLFQVLFARPLVNDLPASRAHLYGDGGGADIAHGTL